MRRKKYNKKIPDALLSKIKTYLELSIKKHPLVDPNKVDAGMYKKRVMQEVQTIYARKGYKTATLYIQNQIDGEKTRLSLDKLYDAFNLFWDESAKLHPNQDDKHKAFMWSLIYRTALTQGEDVAVEHLQKVIEDKKKAAEKLANGSGEEE